MRSMQQAFRAVVVGLLLAASSLAAIAQQLCTEYRVQGYEVPWTAPPEKACQNFVSYWNVSVTPTTGQKLVYVKATTSTCFADIRNSGDNSMTSPSATWQFETRTGNCAGSGCETTTGRAKYNLTVGYKATPSASDAAPFVIEGLADPIAKAGKACIKGCTIGFDFGNVESFGKAWISDVPGANGLYRSSQDVYGTGTGATCTATEADNAVAEPSKSEPPCPGSLGTVNGAKVCLSNVPNKGVKPFGSTPAQSSEASVATRGNPTAGPASESVTDTARASGPGSSGTGGGNAGGPATGPNNSELRKGCNDGSKVTQPACSGSGKLDADGTITTPSSGKQQANCGAPGQPKCAIDETGTPDGKDAFSTANTTLTKTRDDTVTEIGKAAEKKWDAWTFSFRLPAGCTSLPLEPFNMVLDVCRFQPTIHDIMSMVWAIATVMGCTLMVFRTAST